MESSLLDVVRVLFLVLRKAIKKGLCVADSDHEVVVFQHVDVGHKLKLLVVLTSLKHWQGKLHRVFEKGSAGKHLCLVGTAQQG